MDKTSDIVTSFKYTLITDYEGKPVGKRPINSLKLASNFNGYIVDGSYVYSIGTLIKMQEVCGTLTKVFPKLEE